MHDNQKVVSRLLDINPSAKFLPTLMQNAVSELGRRHDLFSKMQDTYLDDMVNSILRLLKDFKELKRQHRKQTTVFENWLQDLIDMADDDMPEPSASPDRETASNLPIAPKGLCVFSLQHRI